MNSINTRFFIYSREQQERIQAANLAAGRPAPKFGEVVVNGVRKIYTDKRIDANSPFADAVVLISGDEYKIRHTEPSFL